MGRLHKLTEDDRDTYKIVPPFAGILQAVESFLVEALITLAIGELKLGKVDSSLRPTKDCSGNWINGTAAILPVDLRF